LLKEKNIQKKNLHCLFYVKLINNNVKTFRDRGSEFVVRW
jgi:hypothetical protein